MRCSPRPLAALLLVASLAACTPFRSPEERRDTGDPPPDARGLDAPSADAPTVPLDTPLGMDAPLVTIDTPPAPLDAPVALDVPTDVPRDCDFDGDGIEDTACGGDDCDDADASVYPRAGDTYGDAVDGDCDGMDCEGGWIDGVYVAACDGSMNWADAAARCVTAGYEGLFEPTTSARDSAFRALVNAVPGLRYSSHWLGLRRMSGSWSWSSGATLDHTAWSSGEPAGDGDCVHYFGAADSRAFGWNDVPCSISTDTGGAGTFSLSPACMSSTCGNGTVEPGEACDDGNTASGDGCSAACGADLRNIAPLATVSQSTTYADGSCDRPASRAVDEAICFDYPSVEGWLVSRSDLLSHYRTAEALSLCATYGPCFQQHTSALPTDWWEAAFADPRWIEEVRIWPWTPGAYRVSVSVDRSIWTSVDVGSEVGSEGAIVPYVAPIAGAFRYVRLQRNCLAEACRLPSYVATTEIEIAGY
jgi:cysteine-rich repeat protein